MSKIKLTFDGCYNYKRLKKEDLIDDKEEIKESKINEVEFIKIHTDLNNDAC